MHEEQRERTNIMEDQRRNQNNAINVGRVATLNQTAEYLLPNGWRKKTIEEETSEEIKEEEEVPDEEGDNLQNKL